MQRLPLYGHPVTLREDGVMVQGGVETEVKIRIANLPAIKDRLLGLGFAPSVQRVFEANTLYDKPDQELRGRGMILRLREAAEKRVITWKGPQQAGPHKSRPELETAIGSTEVLGQMLEQLGYKRDFRYEKYRTELSNSRDGSGSVTVDETPIGNFLELEGPGEWIDKTAQSLGFGPADYILDSYGKLYLADCERRGVEPADMVFAK
jgi:adenylate cyclase, class 2